MSNKNKPAPGGDEKELKDNEVKAPDIQPEPKPVPENGTSRKSDELEEDKNASIESENRDQDLNQKKDENDDDGKKEAACCK